MISVHEFDSNDDDDDDACELTNEELLDYFNDVGHLKTMTYDDTNMEVDVIYLENTMETNVQQEEEEEAAESLSQRLSQLSTTATKEESSTCDTTNKKKRRYSSSPLTTDQTVKRTKASEYDANDGIEPKSDVLPMYLQETNASFVQMADAIMNSTNRIYLDDIQQLAHFIHRLAVLNIQLRIYQIFLQSVIGTLKEPTGDLSNIDLRVWPIQVKSMMLTERTSTTMSSEEEQRACEHLLYERLQQVDKKIQFYQQEFDTFKHTLIELTADMEQSIEAYVQEYGIKRLQMKCDLKVRLLQHYYDAEILQRKFRREQPNEYQMHTFQRIIDVKNELEKSKRELMGLKQRVYYSRPCISDTATIESSKRARLDITAVQIAEIEAKFNLYRTKLELELLSMWRYHQNDDIGYHEMPTRLTNIMHERFNNIEQRWRDSYDFKMNYYLKNAYRDVNSSKNTDESSNYERLPFESCLLIDTKHHFTDRQMHLLSRGPCHVPPCQMYVSSEPVSMDIIIKKTYAPLKHQLLKLFSKHRLSIAMSMNIQQKIYQEFREHFSKSLPMHIQQCAQHEMNLVRSIQDQLRKDNLILRRTADNMNTFYLGHRPTFETFIDDYLLKSDTFELIVDVKEAIDTWNSLLNILKERKSLNSDLIQRFILDPSKIKLPCIQFLPDISQENQLSLVPFLPSQQCITRTISRFLQRILRPFVDHILTPTLFYDEFDFIRKLNDFVYVERRLSAKTYFCSMKIVNYYTLDEHPRMLNVLESILNQYSASNKLENITLLNIKNLLYLFLNNNIFTYKDRLYRYRKGGPSTMPLMDIIANMYLYQWQSKIMDIAIENKQFFGRYKDQLIFTWSPKDDDEDDDDRELRSFVDKIRDNDPHIQLRICISRTVEYLNAYIENRHGTLYTRVFHYPIIDNYTLPYVVGHVKLAHGQWLQWALIRAICFCTTVDGFYQERIYLELTFLINGYSLLFVSKYVQSFFDYFNAESIHYSMDQEKYDHFRRQCLDFIDRRRKLSDDLQKLDDDDRLLHFKYVFEYGQRWQFNQKFQSIWYDYFAQHPVLSPEKCKILLKTETISSLNTLLT